MANQRVKNATQKEYRHIQFKSKLEVMCYKTLLQAGLKPDYEKLKLVVWKGFRPTVPCFIKDPALRILKEEKKKLIDITYTPDFTFYYKKTLIIIEAKGFASDTYKIKKKLFRGWLEQQDDNILFFEVHSQRDVLQAIEIIKALKGKVKSKTKSKTKTKIENKTEDGTNSTTEEISKRDRARHNRRRVQK